MTFTLIYFQIITFCLFYAKILHFLFLTTAELLRSKWKKNSKRLNSLLAKSTRNAWRIFGLVIRGNSLQAILVKGVAT